MTIRYVGSGGDNGNSGLSWANRKLTLNCVEDTPVVAGDTVYVGPGVYRETLTLDVAGSAGNPITYIGDVSGANTDEVGGIVRITGSDNDQTAARTYCINNTGARDYRTFRGFSFDTWSTDAYYTGSGCDYNIIEDCFFQSYSGTGYAVGFRGAAATTNNVIRRCFFFGGRIGTPIYLNYTTSQVDNSNNLVENCIIIGGAVSVNIGRIGGTTIKNCIFISQGSSGGGQAAIRCNTALTGGQTIYVYNNLFIGCGGGVSGTTPGDITENYNTFFGNTTDRENTSTGANSTSYPPLFTPPLFLDDYKLLWNIAELSQWSQVKQIAGTSESTDDLYGIARPATSSKKSWGAVQYQGQQRSSAQAQAGTYSLSLPDAGMVQFKVPVTAVSTVFSVYVYREADYAGTNPQMVIRQPGQSETTVTDANAAGGWNLLTTTLTPAAVPGYVIVELWSNNTAAAGSYNTYFDSLTVT